VGRALDDPAVGSREDRMPSLRKGEGSPANARFAKQWVGRLAALAMQFDGCTASPARGRLLRRTSTKEDRRLDGRHVRVTVLGQRQFGQSSLEP